MRSFSLVYNNKILRINFVSVDNVFGASFYISNEKALGRFISSFLENESCELRIQDSESKDTDIFMKYSQNILRVDYHNTFIVLTRESVINDFEKISQSL